MLDDVDTFEGPHHFLWYFQQFTTPMTVVEELYAPQWKRWRNEELKEKAPTLFRHQEEALLSFLGQERVTEAQMRAAKARRGLSGPRKTPLLSNRTTPKSKTANDLLNRQHSTMSYSPQTRLIGPFLTEFEI